MPPFKWEALRRIRMAKWLECRGFGGSGDGAVLAIVLRMNNRTANRRVDSLRSLLRVSRGFAEGSMVALGFGLAILLIGTPLALLVRGVHDGLSWLVGLGGEPTVLMDAVVYFSSMVGTVILVALLFRLLVGFLHWRRRFRARVSSGRTADTRVNSHQIAEAAS